jgi:hypothetical protein
MLRFIRYFGHTMLLMLLAFALVGPVPATYAAGITWFVNPTTGNNLNPGTQSQPFKSLGRALKSAKSGDTIKLAQGTYGKNGANTGNNEVFGTGGLLVPAGVTIAGTLHAPGVQGSFLSSMSADETALTFAGGATVKDLEVDVFKVGFKASTGTLTLSNLNFIINQTTIQLSNTAQAILSGGYLYLDANKPNVYGVDVSGQAQFTMVGGRIEGTGPNTQSTGAGVRGRNAGRITLKDGAQVKNTPGSAVFVQDTANATLDSVTVVHEVPANYVPQPSILASGSATLSLTKSKIYGSGGVSSEGVTTKDLAKLTVTGGTISGHTGAGIRGYNPLKLTVTDSSIGQNGYGIDLRDKNASLTLNGAFIIANAVGVQTPAATIRKSRFNTNVTGLNITGASADLGTLADPGNNILQQNGRTSVSFGYLVSAGRISAVGNTWNSGVQDANTYGLYTVHKVVNGSSTTVGTNYILFVDTTAIEL